MGDSAVVKALPSHAGLCGGRRIISLASRGNKMNGKNKNINTKQEERDVEVEKEGEIAGGEENRAELKDIRGREFESVGPVLPGDKDPFGEGGAVSRSPPRFRTNSLPDMYASKSISNVEGHYVFIPKKSLARTPPSGPRFLGQSSHQEQKGSNNETECLTQATKRKRQDLTPDIGAKAQSEGLLAKKILDHMLKNIALLEKVVAESYKPKKELTDISSRLTYLAKQITSEDQGRWLENLLVKGQEIEQIREENSDLRKRIKDLEQSEESKVIEALKISVGCQADPKEIQRAQEENDTQTKERIKSVLEADKVYSNLTKIIDERWTEDIFERTKVCTTSTQSSYCAENDEDLALFVDPNYVKDKAKAEELKRKITGIGHIIDEELEEGKMEFVKLQTDVQKGTSNDSMRYMNVIFALPMTMDSSDIANLETIYQLVTQLKDETIKQTGRKLKVVTAEETNVNYIRRTLEYVFRDTDISISVIGKHEKRSGDGQRRNNRLEKEKIIVKAQPGKSYADLLRSVKSSVNIEDKGINIKAIKKTNKGDLLLEVTGGKGKALALKQDIQQNNQDAEVVIKTNEITVHITDIDASIGKEELKEEIMKAENLLENQVNVISMRPTRNGNQTATVALKRDTARKVVKQGTIKIGWVHCRVRNRVSLQRCYRCHMFGHRKDECGYEDRSELCLKCTKPGHIARECKNTPMCVVCKKEGHHADQTKCPAYRKLIEEKSRSLLMPRTKERTTSTYGN